MKKALNGIVYALWFPAGLACLLFLGAVSEGTPWWIRLILISFALPLAVLGLPGFITIVIMEK